jgi:hypothetical protein
LGDRQGHAARGDGNNERAEHAGAAVEGQNAGVDREERQRVYREREDQSAEQTDANGVEDESKGEHGGGCRCKGVTVAPSTTTAAQAEV